jgi:phosphatidylglycerophosphatase A
VARVREKLAHVLALWFGCGLVPYAPGTAGTLGAIPLYLLLRTHGWIAVAIAALIVTVVGVWSASVVARETGSKDPQKVVIDEVAGFLVTMLPAPRSGWWWVAGGFVLFRVLDQLKPWPARAAERAWPGGWGIVFDDVFAGVWGAAVLLAIRLATGR